MEIKQSEIGSFSVFGKPCSLGSVYTVKYKAEHNQFFEWQFINNLDEAEEFAKRKTKKDKRSFGG